jgi:hypothetical protein
MRSLFKAIERLLEKTYMIRERAILKTERLLTVDSFKEP